MNQTTRGELDEIITALLEGECNVEQKERLEHLLREDWECRRHYLASVDLHAALLQSPMLASGRLHVPRRKRVAFPKWIALAAAACVLLAASAAFVVGSRRHAPVAEVEPVSNGCAVVVQVHGDSGLSSGMILNAGPLRLRGGLARIEFFCGATVLLEGEAELDIRSAWEATCRSGKARVSVPPAAEGFQLRAPGLRLVDLGTEFAVSVDATGAAEVHVFEGEVEAYPDGEAMRLVSGGESLRRGMNGPLVAGIAQPGGFTSAGQMDTLVNGEARARFEAWWKWSQQMSQDPRLVAYYPFRRWEKESWDRFVNNVAATRDQQRPRTGTAVGARWTQGRWPMKDALEFKGPADRVRIFLGKEDYSAITLACWVRVDALDRKYNALLLTDGYDPGEPHWQIYEDGRLMFSLDYAPADWPSPKRGELNQKYFSQPVFAAERLGRWHHVAVTYDSQSGEAVQYFDGKEVGREISPLHQPGRPIHFGPCELGNWGLPIEGHQFPVRNLNGRMDEFAIYNAALSTTEIAALYETGKPE